ncbi:hypothetical protein ISE08_30980 [Pseudomonas aeruginosa]|uniref:hypothetical protein n=1 Tax=Pseudomonas aeruginosa TaxID=287 RepID=UPI0012AC5745|nr:hypothetical protein [Pseudomonas aeruginosa]MBX5822368.1 hypothetical protein [Pseudomonas aeruginosa]MBX5834762.1 hypothetical protein [Pseudomonas aeruginosa]MBX5884815.1 hypothetical protein [Pseudomonas aeruginosa]NHY04550.1 hypothetical protein [Pseudomonas aeruginosa]NHY25298.1 hypothetical protein [Pseudomonas aeruginosa]
MQLFLLKCDAVHYANWNCEPLDIGFESFVAVFDDSAGHSPPEAHSPADVIAKDDFPRLIVVVGASDISPVGRQTASNNSVVVY